MSILAELGGRECVAEVAVDAAVSRLAPRVSKTALNTDSSCTRQASVDMRTCSLTHRAYAVMRQREIYWLSAGAWEIFTIPCMTGLFQPWKPYTVHA